MRIIYNCGSFGRCC